MYTYSYWTNKACKIGLKDTKSQKHIIMYYKQVSIYSSRTTLCLSIANLLCSSSALTTIRGVHVFWSLSAGLTGAQESLQPSSKEVSQLDMWHPPPRQAHKRQIHTSTCTNVASLTTPNCFLLSFFLICRSLFLFFSHSNP